MEEMTTTMSLEDQIEYLEQAKDILLEYQDTCEERKEQQVIVDELEAAVSKGRSALEEKITTAVSKRRGEIESNYDKQINKIKADLDRAQRKLDEAREKAVGERVANETREFRVEKTNLVNELHEIYRQEKIPVICRNFLYFSLHCPGGLKEILGLLTYIILCYLALPAGIIYFMTDHSRFHIILVAVLDILVWGLLYIIVHTLSRSGRGEAFGKLRRIRSQIRQKKRQIAKIEKSIRREEDDERYELTEYQETLSTFRDAYEAASREKKEALETFERETKKQIEDEIKGNALAPIEDMELRLQDADRTLTDLNQIEQALGRRMNERYANSLGEEFLDEDRLNGLIRAFRQGAANMMEAQEHVLANEGKKKKKK